MAISVACCALRSPMTRNVHAASRGLSSSSSAPRVVAPHRVPSGSTAGRRPRLATRIGSSCDSESEAIERRDVLAALIAAIPAVQLAIPSGPAQAAYGSSGAGGDVAAGESLSFTTFYGAAAPPATYGSVGGTTPDKAKYSYEVPSTWVEEATSKVEKGAGGQDSRWVLAGSRGRVKAFCLTLNRAGQDGAAYELTDSAINAVAAADSSLQSVLLSGAVTTKSSTIDGQDYITYDIESSQHYLMKLSIDNTGRLFAFIITAPDRTFQQEKKTFERMVDSFRTYRSVSQFV